MKALSPFEIEIFRRCAWELHKILGIGHSQALDDVARALKFDRWSHLKHLSQERPEMTLTPNPGMRRRRGGDGISASSADATSLLRMPIAIAWFVKRYRPVMPHEVATMDEADIQTLLSQRFRDLSSTDGATAMRLLVGRSAWVPIQASIK